MAKIYDVLEMAGFECLAANPTPAFKGRMYFNTTLGQVRIYDGAAWTIVGGSGGGGAVWVMTGTFAAPIAITALGGVSLTASAEECICIVGSGGAVDITANPQIAAGNANGDVVELIGTSDVNTVLFEDGTGLALNGPWLAQAGSTLSLRWDATSALWRERFRS
jgi:hypothetical protein